jgi:serine/threonine protein kinase/Tfp pilus assembly protein PilF
MPTKCPTCHSENPNEKQFCGDCGTKLGVSPDVPLSITKTLDLPTHGLEKGSVFADRYEIIEQLGEGGMGQVYRAHDTQIEEDIEIKVLRPEIALDKKILERFRNELKFARKITHKSVCRMHDISVADGTTYITMEYVEGEDLKSVIRRKGKLGIGQAMGVALQITDGLIEAHNLGIVHRDLKPQNIMIDPDGNAKIMDFGIARSTQAEGVTQEGSIIGTPEYMSPEQVEGRTVDHRSDIYSLAVILYEMLTGQIPFSGETVLDIALKHKSQIPDNPQHLNKKIPDALTDLILLSMVKNPEERFQSAEELLQSLLGIEKSLPESERSAMRIVPRLPGQKIAPFSLKKVLIPTAAVSAIVVLVLITWRLLFPPSTVKETGRPTVAVLTFNNNTGDPSYDEWRNILPDMLVSDLMQSKYLSVASQVQIYSFLRRKGLLDARNYTLEDLNELAEEVRASHLVQGFFTKSGDNFTISVNLQDAKSLNIIGAGDVSGRGIDSFASMVDDLTPLLKPYLGLTTEDIDNDFDENIADVKSPIPGAYNFFVRARRAKIENRYEEAIELLEKAVALDPDFATAYRFKAEIHGTGDLYGRERELERKRDSTKQAFEAMQRRRVTERERLSIEAFNYIFVEHDEGKASDKLEELLSIYPDDYDANHILGSLLFNFGDYKRSIKYFEAAIKSSFVTTGDFQALGNCYIVIQQYEKARGILRLGLEKFPDYWDFNCMIATSYCWEGQYEKALAECENMHLADPLTAGNCIARGETLYFMEDFRASEQEFKKILDREKVEDRTSGRWWLVSLYKLQGRFAEIFEQVELSKEDPNAQLTQGLMDIYAAWGDFETVEKAIDDWKSINPKEMFLWIPYYRGVIKAKRKQWGEAIAVIDGWNGLLKKWDWITRYKLFNLLNADLQGRIELERGNHDLAIEYLEQAKEHIPGFNSFHHAWHLEALARAYYESGNLERAREEYALITTLRGGRRGSGHIYAKSFYMLGKIAEELGDRREAKKQYTRFLELWKDADPGLPEVEDAKTRLTSL